MPNFSNGKIYKITCNITNKIYIGATCKTLNARISNHKNDYKRSLKNKYNYVSSHDIIKNNDYKIELIENYPCNNKKELQEREKYFINTIHCINKYMKNKTQ
jgi:P2-related tail formation protein